MVDLVRVPSTSTSYRFLQASKKPIISSIDTPRNEFVNNIEVSVESPKYGYMLEIDETYMDAKVRWNPRDNKIYGICYEHGRDENLSFNSYEHVESLSNMVKDGVLHVPKETMLITCSSNSLNCKAQVVAVLPTCTKNEIHYQANLIDQVSSDFAKKNGAPFLNWSTDGDPARRQLFDSLMSYDLDEDSDIYPTISRLRLIDRKVGRNEETVNFDAKHLAKRTGKCLIGNNVNFGDEKVLTKTDMEKVLTCSPNEFSHSTSQLMSPNDKQNVPLVTELLMQFIKSVEDVENSFRVADVAAELHLLKYVVEGILVTHTKVEASIRDVLFILLKNLKNFLPNQLYHDLQASFEDAFYCPVKWKLYHPYEPLYLMLCSNDVIERCFGNLWLKYRQCAVDNLELIYATQAIQLCTDMMIKHPDWFSKNRNVMQRLCLDYSNPRDWNRDKLVLREVDIVSAWNMARAMAEQVLNKFTRYQGDVSDFAQLALDGHTLLVPCGRKIGLNPQEIDYSLDLEVINEEVEDQGNNNPSEEASGDRGR